MKSILFLTPELPYPPFSGGRIKSWNLVGFLRDHYDLTVGCILKGNDEDYLEDFEIRSNLREFFNVPVKVPRSASNLVKSYLKRMPLNPYRTYSRRFAEIVDKKAFDYDMIFVDHYEVFQYVPETYRGLVVLHEHNAYYVMWERYAKAGQNPFKRLVSYLEAQRVKRWEASACGRADLVLAAPNDIENLVKIGVDREKCHETYHLGDDTQLDLPDLRFEDTEKALMYLGTLNWEANVDGLLWFMDQIWPELKTRHSDLKLYVIGKNPDKRLLDAAEADPDIVFTGFVEDPEAYFKRSRVFIAPLRFGSGIKVKVLNAMYRGIPVVTTSVGTEGLAARHMHHLALADTPEDMVQSIQRLLTDTQIWQHLRQESRKLVAEQYTWKKLFADMKHILDAQFERNEKNKP